MFITYMLITWPMLHGSCVLLTAVRPALSHNVFFTHNSIIINFWNINIISLNIYYY